MAKIRTMRLQPGITYGPIISRRLGRSLGINLLPTRYKVCPYDCIYCQYGRTRANTATENEFPTAAEVLSAVQGAIREYPYTDYITFSGNGEATMHPHFAEIVTGVIALRDELGVHAKVAILSNSALVTPSAVRAALAWLDVRIMKLDAGDTATWRAINRPAPNLRFAQIVAGLRSLHETSPIIIQCLMLDGAITNTRGAALEQWLNLLATIIPQEVQIYTTDRPSAEGTVQKVRRDRLKEIAHIARSRYNLNMTAY